MTMATSSKTTSTRMDTMQRRRRRTRRDTTKRRAAPSSSLSSRSSTFTVTLLSRLVIVCLILLATLMVVANLVLLWPPFSSVTATKRRSDNPSESSTSNNNIHSNIHSKTTHNVIVDMFREAGVELTADELRDLPTWTEVVSQFGEAPIVHGLDKCATFRNNIPPLERNLGSAGMFNSGTNLVTQLLKQNCKIPERLAKYGANASREAHGIRWQVSWGKHTPAHFKWEHATDHAKNIDKETILPVVAIRDPYEWMKSMCRNGYTARWTHGPRRCPNLVQEQPELQHGGKIVKRQTITSQQQQQQLQPVPVNVTYADHRQSHHSSLAHLWNDWYKEYVYDANYPRLVVRFEDLIFYSKQVTSLICECAGGQVQLPFDYIVQPAKTGPGHGKKSERTGMVQAWIKYGKPQQQQQQQKQGASFHQLQDYLAAKEFLNDTLMKTFGYTHPPPPP